MEICVMQDVTSWLSHTTHWADTLQTMHWHLPFTLADLADKPLSDDLGANVQKSFNNFVKSGQVWALLIGIILGYIFRSLTSYG